MDVNALIEPRLDLDRLAHVLDELGNAGRLWAIRKWTPALQADLFEAVKGRAVLTLEDLVPAATAPLTEVIHDGQNTLPLFNHFQKRFCRPGEGVPARVLYGYNHNGTMGLTGPGYFVARPSDAAPGEVLIDYRSVPSVKPDPWPAIVPNGQRLGRFVYEGMVDHVRKVSEHVCIGRAQRGDELMDAWFVLCRRDSAPT